MKIKFLFFVIFIFSRLSESSAKEDTTILYLTHKGSSFVDKYKKKKLTWSFNNNDSLHFAFPNYDDSKWLRISSKLNQDTAKKHKITNKYSWFRLKMKADSSVIGEAFALRFDGFGLAYIYQDGKLLDSIINYDGNEKNSVSFKNHPIFTTINDTHIHVLAVRYYSTVDEEEITDEWGFGLFVDNANQTVEEIKEKILFSGYYILSFACMFATLFLVHLILFLFYRKDLSNLYFALFNFCFAIFSFGMYNLAIGEFGSSKLLGKTVIIAVVLACFSISAFSSYLFGKSKLFFKIIMCYSIILIVWTILSDINSGDSLGYALLILFLFAILYTAILFLKAILKKVPGSRILGAGVLITFSFVLFVFFEAIIAGGVNITVSAENKTIADYLLIIFLFLAVVSIPISITAFLAWRFSSTSKNLSKQLATVETLSAEKQSILENQNAELEKQVTVRTKQIAEEKKRSDDLLLNILPEEVAEELKIKGESKAQRYDEVSVLFTDFVNFTKISEQIGVEELLNELNINFTAFDRIMENHCLEKIKTIGDAYLAVCGLPLANEHHAQNTVNAALEILEFVQKRKQEVPYGLDIRIGINSGSLIAGIIGVKKFAYDIWGDTVNTAARMEQSSEPGKINISENTFVLVKGEFMCTHRGKLQAKGKGEMDMYFVERKKM